MPFEPRPPVGEIEMTAIVLRGFPPEQLESRMGPFLERAGREPALQSRQDWITLAAYCAVRAWSRDT